MMGAWGTGYFDNDEAGDAVSFLTIGRKVRVKGRLKKLYGVDLLRHGLKEAADLPIRHGLFTEMEVGRAYAALVAAAASGSDKILGPRFRHIHDDGEFLLWFDAYRMAGVTRADVWLALKAMHRITDATLGDAAMSASVARQWDTKNRALLKELVRLATDLTLWTRQGKIRKRQPRR